MARVTGSRVTVCVCAREKGVHVNTDQERKKRVTFDPEVVFEGLGQDLGSLVADERVVVDGDATQARHFVQVRLAVAEAVSPGLRVSPHALMLQTDEFRRQCEHPSLHLC